MPVVEEIPMYRTKSLARAIAAAVATSSPALAADLPAGVATCSISDIQIKQATLVHRGSKSQFSLIVGELYNGCGAATGVRLHVTLRDKAGQVISASNPWPAGSNNIPPKSSYSFELPAEEDRPAVVVQIEPEKIRVW
jgi:hypothetical protein